MEKKDTRKKVWSKKFFEKKRKKKKMIRKEKGKEMRKRIKGVVAQQRELYPGDPLRSNERLSSAIFLTLKRKKNQ